MKKNELYTAVCENYTHEGMGVVKIDGFPLFVKGMMKGEKAQIRVTLAKKNYGFARIEKMIEPSSERVTPPCPYAKTCGGCQLQHMSLKEQREFKEQKVNDVLHRIGKLDLDVSAMHSMECPDNYRNKGQIPVGEKNGRVITGFYRINSNDIVDMNNCMIQSEKINEVMRGMKELLRKYPVAQYFRHMLIKHAFYTDEVMLVWIVRKNKFQYQKQMLDAMLEKFPYIKTVVVNLNQRNDNVILGDKETILYGDGYITDVLDGLKFRISSKSFYQVNPVQAEVLYQRAVELAQLKGNETVIDLYCGVGTISMFLAREAKNVIGIEVVPQAIADAKVNAKMNGLNNIKFLCSDAGTFAAELVKKEQKIDVVVVDPPRKGCDQLTLESIVKMNPERIVYVSCDPATLARDLKILDELNYRAEIVECVNQFEYTHHVESVCLIVKK